MEPESELDTNSNTGMDNRQQANTFNNRHDLDTIEKGNSKADTKLSKAGKPGTTPK